MLSKKAIEKMDSLHIVDEYVSGKTMKEISEQYKIGTNNISLYLRLKNIPSRPSKRRKSIRNVPPVGKKFGLWTVISEETKSGSELNIGSSDRTLYWLVQCECGHTAWKNPSHLKDGTSTRCQHCGNKNYISDDGEVIIESVILSKFRHVYNNAKKRKKVSNLDFDITPEYLNELYLNNHCCALSGLDLTIELNKTVNQQNISIDRIDSNIGYVKGNVQLVDKRINMMKGTLSNEEFIELCCKVAEHNGWSKCG